MSGKGDSRVDTIKLLFFRILLTRLKYRVSKNPYILHQRESILASQRYEAFLAFVNCY
jgi:hypothetical protein